MSAGNPSRTRRSWPRRLLRLAALIYIGLAVLFYLLQDRLLFDRQPLNAATAAEIVRAHPEVEPVAIDVDAGVTLDGWLAPGTATTPRPLVIYFGGNAEEVSWMIRRHAQFPEWSLLLVNYRGYGRSGGVPGEAVLLADALKIYDDIADRADIDRNRIVAMGRSLGTGVAVHLATQRSLAGVILITPYDSMLAVAQVHYPFLPVGLLLRHRFDSISRARRINIPMLALVAENDEVIPPPQARTLAAAWAGPTVWQLFADSDHINISRSPLFWQRIREFLASLGPAPPAPVNATH